MDMIETTNSCDRPFISYAAEAGRPVHPRGLVRHMESLDRARIWTVYNDFHAPPSTIAKMLNLKVTSVHGCTASMRHHKTLFLKRGRPRTVRDEQAIIGPVVENLMLAIRTEAKELTAPCSAVRQASIKNHLHYSKAIAISGLTLAHIQNRKIFCDAELPGGTPLSALPKIFTVTSTPQHLAQTLIIFHRNPFNHWYYKEQSNNGDDKTRFRSQSSKSHNYEWLIFAQRIPCAE
jgi:hypothetical protein